MRGVVLLTLAALFAAPAAAQDRACRDMRALLNADGGDFRAIAWTINPRAGVRPTVEGRRIRFPAAPDCELTVETGRSTGFSCRWELATSAEAGAVYDQLVGQINACIASPLRAGSPYGGTAVRLVQSHHGSFVTRARQTDIDLDLFEHGPTGEGSPAGARPVLYVVELEVELDTASVVTPEDLEADGDREGGS